MESNDGTWQLRTGTDNLKNPIEGERYDISREVPKEPYDLAILFTEEHMHFHSKAQPICLYEEMPLGKLHGTDKNRNISRFEWNEDLTKRIVREIIRIDACDDTTLTCTTGEKQTEKICPHDSGAPILTWEDHFFLTGILSNIEGCKDQDTTFTKVEGVQEDDEKAYKLWKSIIEELDPGNNQGTLF